ARTRPTSDFTGFWRWLVPRNAAPGPASAATCSGRTCDGPHPNRPSAGLSSAGIWRAVIVAVTTSSLPAADPRGAGPPVLVVTVRWPGPRRAGTQETGPAPRSRAVCRPGILGAGAVAGPPVHPPVCTGGD